MDNFSRVAALEQLRTGEPLELPITLTPAHETEARELEAVLAQAYRDDARTWPGPPPPFHAGVAVWALEAVLRVGYRWYVGQDGTLISPAPAAPTEPETAAGYHLSADLTLRYLPPLLARIAGQSPDDVLLEETAALHTAFPYTFLLYARDASLSPKPAWPAALAALANATFRGAVVDRVIARDRLEVAQHPDFLPHVEAALGTHAQTLWPRFHRMRGEQPHA